MARHGSAWDRKVIRQSYAKASVVVRIGDVRCGADGIGQARLGLVWRGWAGDGMAWHGSERTSASHRGSVAGRLVDTALRGQVRTGAARRVAAGCGTVRLGMGANAHSDVTSRKR
jgi:hypothetical protein